MSVESDRDLADLLPWLVNGSLAGAERTAVLNLLSRSPDAALELRLWKAVQSEVRRETAESGVEMGWRRLEKSVRQQRARERPARYWRVAAAVAAVAIVGFQSLILWRMEQRDAGLTQLGAPPAVVGAHEWLVQIRFTEAATVAQVNSLLAEIGGRVVDGPSALGVYQIAVPREGPFESTDALLEWLRTQAIVEEGVLPPQPAETAP
jgi:hypothetical protein